MPFQTVTVVMFSDLKDDMPVVRIATTVALVLGGMVSGEAHGLKLPMLARNQSNHLHELFYDRRLW